MDKTDSFDLEDYVESYEHTQQSLPKDCILCSDWLDQMGLTQYSQTMQANFSHNGEKNILSIKKLAALRLQDLPRLNITNYDHQRVLMEQIKLLNITKYHVNTTGSHSPGKDNNTPGSRRGSFAPMFDGTNSRRGSLQANDMQGRAVSRRGSFGPQEMYNEQQGILESQGLIDNMNGKLNLTHLDQIDGGIKSRKNSAISIAIAQNNNTIPEGSEENIKDLNLNINIAHLNGFGARTASTSELSLNTSSTANILPKMTSFRINTNNTDNEGVTANNNTVTASSSTVLLPSVRSPEEPSKYSLIQKRALNERRKTFDSQIWGTINKFKPKDQTQVALENLRSGAYKTKDPLQVAAEDQKNGVETSTLDEDADKKSQAQRRRRWTYHQDNANNEALNDHEKALNYGNMAQEFDMIQTELRQLQGEILGGFKETIGCEVANILFLNNRTGELMLYAENKWIRVPVLKSLAGVCVQSGDTLHIPDAYADPRFYRNVDKLTGFKTRNILCEPVRVNFGGGQIVAVVQMINKINPEGFTPEDEIVLKACVFKVADQLADRFKELLNAAEMVLGNSESLVNDGGAVNPKHRYDEETMASRMNSQRDFTKLTTKEMILRNDKMGVRNDSVGVDGGGGSRQEALSDERRRRSRRLSYNGHIAPLLPVSLTSEADSLPKITRVPSDEKPKWVGKVLKVVEDAAAAASATPAGDNNNNNNNSHMFKVEANTKATDPPTKKVSFNGNRS
eukprot:gene3161-6238_t